jgi:integrator complex subunit 6/ATP-dependent RNA helicase DDX26B
MIICFVVDTSASMNQKIQNPSGLTLLDCAKASIEYFLRIRGRDINMRNDNFFLVTTEDGPAAVKVELVI